MRTQHRWDAGLHSYSLCFLILVLLFQCLVFPGFSFGLQLEAQSFTFKFDGLSEQLMSDGFTYITKYLTSDMDDTFAFGAVRKSLNAHTLAVWLDVPTKLLATVVWSANRNQPVTVNGSMSFVANGSLVFNDSDGREVWSTHTDGRGGLGIRLQDSGNLVVYNDLNESVWQSFDFPSDTLLQGQVLSPGMQLVSSVSDRNLSEGSYSLVMATGGLACYAISPNPLPYWIWGYYGKNDTDSLKQTCQHPTQLTLASNRAGILIMSQTNATNLSSGTSSALCNIPTKDLQVRTQTFLSNYTRFLRIEPDGNLRIYVYSGALNVDYDLFPSTGQCRLPDTCGPYGVCNGSTGQCSCPDNFLRVNASSPSQGCYLKSGELTCNQTNTRTYKLVELPGVDYFPNKFVPNSEQTVLTKANCMDLCLQNCSCTSSFFYETSSSCFIFTDPLQTLQVVPDQSKLGFIKVQDQQLPSSNKKQALAGGVIGSLIAVCAFLSAIFWYRRKRNTKTVYRNTEDESFITMLPGILTRFSYHDLRVATEGFRKQLGAGGFGSVYEGSLSDGTKIAVKKLEGARQGQKEFRAEVVTIGSINHINLVRLRGFCSEGFDYLLVYEYMPNGSLEKWLFGKDESSTILNWQRRLQIALGTARGLAYLHDECRERIIHLDIKPQNILLDDSFLPKVADFGLSKLVDRNQTMVYTTMRGTPGYLAPEWLLHAAVTDRTDVFSYGMVLLELVTGRKAFDIKCTDPEKQYLPAWVVYEIQQGRMMEVVDKLLHGDVDKEEVELLIHIGLLCIKDEMESRPSMTTVVQMLEGRVMVPHPQLEAYRFSGQRAFTSNSSSRESYNWNTTNTSNSTFTDNTSNSTTSFISNKSVSEMYLSNPR